MLEIINGFISCFIFMISLYVYGLILYGKNNNIKIIKKILIFMTICIIHTFISLYLDEVIKTISLCVIYSFFIKLQFNQQINKALFASIVYIILALIPDLLVVIIMTNGVSKEYFYSTLAGGIISNIFVSIITVILIYFLRKPLKKLFNYNLSSSKKIIFVSILTILFIIHFVYKFSSGYQMNQNIIMYLLTIFGFMIVLFTLFKQKIENESILKKYDDLLNVMKNYESDIEEQRTILHETRNELMTIKGKINDKVKEKEIIKYIDSILGDKVSSNMSKYSKFKYLPSNGIKGFFYYKFMEAEKRNINVSVNISKKIENSFLGDIDTKNFKDLVRIIGVYIDNAIDASENSKDKKLGIEIYMIDKDIEIIISNTFENEINIEKIGKEKFTTKGKNRGHGLLLVKHILHGNSIFESDNEIIKNLYIQKLKIKQNKNSD